MSGIKWSVLTSQEDFVREHGDWLLRVAYQLTGQRADALDLAQEVVVDVLRGWEHVQRAKQPRAYMRRMTLNRFLRSSPRGSEKLTDELGHLGESDDRWEDDVVVRALLWGALQKLPPHHRAALVLRYYEDLSDDDIAAALECRPATVRSWVARGLHRLRAQIDDPRTVSKENP